MGNYEIDQSDFIESAAYVMGIEPYTSNNAPCKAPCQSCGGSCYGCKGSKGTELSSLGMKSGLLAMVEDVID